MPAEKGRMVIQPLGNEFTLIINSRYLSERRQSREIVDRPSPLPVTLSESHEKAVDRSQISVGKREEAAKDSRSSGSCFSTKSKRRTRCRKDPIVEQSFDVIISPKRPSSGARQFRAIALYSGSGSIEFPVR
jgi:hypothetical protein